VDRTGDVRQDGVWQAGKGPVRYGLDSYSTGWTCVTREGIIWNANACFAGAL
jgi:hypothetical protein